MDFREIGMLVSEDRLSLEYHWKKRGKTVSPTVIPPSALIIREGEVGV